jgi:hypothetical protein
MQDPRPTQGKRYSRIQLHFGDENKASSGPSSARAIRRHNGVRPATTVLEVVQK